MVDLIFILIRSLSEACVLLLSFCGRTSVIISDIGKKATTLMDIFLSLPLLSLSLDIFVSWRWSVMRRITTIPKWLQRSHWFPSRSMAVHNSWHFSARQGPCRHCSPNNLSSFVVVWSCCLCGVAAVAYWLQLKLNAQSLNDGRLSVIQSFSQSDSAADLSMIEMVMVLSNITFCSPLFISHHLIL